jgi:dTDP-4-amino-4,6-dideoxygalactose transaminase
MPIPVFRAQLPPQATDAVKKCLQSGWIGYGPECQKLEKAFTFKRGGHALATNSCTSALYLAGKLCQRTEHDEIIVPAITFVSTAMAFYSAGFRVRLADVDPDSLLIDPSSVKKLINPNTRAIVVVHLYGQKAPTAELRELCDGFDIDLIEDCAHRLDLLDEEPPSGNYACYSFNAVKEIPCGEGGLLWVKNAADGERVRTLSNLGLHFDTMQRSATLKHADYSFSSEVGLKMRLNDIAASVVNASLESLPLTRHRRQEIFNYYDDNLKQVTPFINPLKRTGSDSYLMYVAKVSDYSRENLQSNLARDEIATSVHYPSLTRHPIFKEAGDRCEKAELLSEQVVTLPCFLELSSSEQERVVQSLTKAVLNKVS